MKTRPCRKAIAAAAVVVAVMGGAMVVVSNARATAVPANAGKGQDQLPPPQFPGKTDHPHPAVDRVGGSSESSLPPPDPYSQYNLLYQGGAVQTSPNIYIVYWGNWNLSNDPYNLGGRVYNFFRGVGGSGWNNTVTQYASGCTVNTISCPSTAAHISNTTGQLKGTWNDTGNPVPGSPVSWNAIAYEAVRGAIHFGVSGANYTIVVALPRGSDDYLFVTQGGGACGWHDFASGRSGAGYTYTVPFIALDYIPDAGSSCGNNSHGSITDGATIVASHEYQETETDPWATASGYMGWRDALGSEEGDKCNWSYNNSTYSTNVTFSTGTFPVQPTWSNYYRYYNQTGCMYSEYW